MDLLEDSAVRGPAQPDLEAALLEVVREVARELHPKGGAAPVELDRTLTDAGIDSLGRIELLRRVEERFRIALPEGAAVAAETPRDLARAVASASPAVPDAVGGLASELAASPAVEVPTGAETLVDVLRWHAERGGQRPWLALLGDSGTRPEVTSWADLLSGAERVAAGLRAAGLAPGETAALMLPTCRDFFLGFHGILLAGGVPVPIYPPVRMAQIEDHLRRQVAILASARCRLLLTVPAAERLGPILRAHLPDLRRITTVGELQSEAPTGALPTPRAHDTALLQYTSGSTGSPKGVVLTHANLLANVRAMGARIDVGAGDVFVSWLPLYHDMGLIGASLGTLYFGLPLVLLPPESFIARPVRWLRAIGRFGGTISAAPSFGYEVCATRVADEDLAGLDLSSWRVAFNGAEPVHPGTVQRFCERYEPYGFRSRAMMPVYGLAECSLGLTFPPPGRGVRVDRLDRAALLQAGRAQPAGEDDANPLAVVSCGRPLAGHEVRIVDRAGREVGEGHVGRLQFRGPSATSGYFEDREATAALVSGEWLESGDLAYVRAGEVYVTGRVKDLIVVAGRNLHPDELEQRVGDVPGIRKGCVVAFGVQDPHERVERLVVLAETRLTEPPELEELRARIVRAATEIVGVAPGDVVLAPPRTVLKTSSGKVRRSACRELYEEGALGRSRPIWWQLTRLTIGGARSRLVRGAHRLGASLFAARAWAAGLIVALPTAIGILVWPRLAGRRRLVRGAVRLGLWLAGLPLALRGGRRLRAAGPFVIVANHASYLDSIVLAGVLPLDAAFAAKAELADRFATRLLLGRLGHRFVDRTDPARGVRDVDRVVAALCNGESVVFFPEGTLVRAPGLRSFHMGAFVAAARTGAPVVPVAIRGTRSILRAGSWFPRSGRITVRFGNPIRHAGGGWDGALLLRDAARREILLHCGEPDLVDELVAPPAPQDAS